MKKIILVIIMCILSTSSFAKDEVFSVHNVKMDITSKTAAQAKNTAVLTAQKQAFNILIKRLSMLNANEIIALEVEDKDINSILADFDISEEKSSDVRYTGIFNFNFNPKKTSAFFKTKGVAFTSIKSSPVLIIPIWIKENYRGKEEALLWEDGNLWKQAWEKFPNDSFLVPTKLPVGDLRDLSQISTSKIIEGEIEDLDNILDRYDVKDLVVTIANKDSKGLTIYTKRYGLDEISAQSSIFINGNNKTYGEVLSEAVAKVNNELSTLWKEKTITKADEISYIDASIEISSIEDLNKIKDLIKDITIINEYKENILSVDQVTFDIYYQGSFFDFKLAMSQYGIFAEKTGTYSCKLNWED